ncbi:MAG: plasmid recombination protein [Clostridia bacterium]
MKRTISITKGKGSVGHNSRAFKAENVDAERIHLNTAFCSEKIETAYHKLFDEALEKYNAKQTRKDRKIPNYYEKIRLSKQEKLFYEIVVQVGDYDNMNAQSENGKLAEIILKEYMANFQKRNPTLYVFSAHLHMDEATPHLHIDFIPFTHGNKRGLETRTTLKGALNKLGFTGGAKGDTELSQWQNHEKEEVAFIMSEYDVEWEKKGEVKEHLSVLDFKKEKRTEEVKNLDEQITKHKKSIEKINSQKSKIKNIESIETKSKTFDKTKVVVDKADFEDVKTLAKKQIVYDNHDDKFKKKIGELKEKNTELYRVNNSLKNENDNLESKLDQSRAINQDLKNEIRHIKFENSNIIYKLEKEIKGLKARFERVMQFLEKKGLLEQFEKILNRNRGQER